MLDKNGNEIQLGDRVFATKHIYDNKVYKGKILRIQSYPLDNRVPQILVDLGDRSTLWFHNTCVTTDQ